MGKTSSASKNKYNKNAYKRYEFVVGVNKKLNYLLDEHKQKGGNVSELVKNLLATHFEIDPNENYFPLRFDKDGQLVQK